MRMKILLCTYILVIVGGLDRGIVGLLDLNLVAAIFGGGSAISRMIYILLGLAALYTIYSAARDSP